MFFSIPNLRSSVVSEVEEPWNLKTATPPPYEEGKEAVIEFCNRVSTQHAMLSMVEGMSPGVRVTMADNVPYKLHGLLVDYDNPLPENPIQYIKDHKPCEFMPTYLSTTSSGNGRLVWEFEKPILFSDTGHMKEFMKILAKSMRLNKWLGGLDTAALTNWVKYYELGRNWQAVDAMASVPLSHLELWYFKAAEERKFDDFKKIEYKIPIEDLAAEVEAHFPNRWSGPFVYGARGIRFWDSSADNDTAAVVMPEGMLCYTGDQAFVPWRQLFGAAFVEQYEADAISDIVTSSAYDGDKFWMKQPNGGWITVSKDDFSQEMRVRGKDSRRKPGQTASEIDVIENHIKKHCKIVAALPFLFFPTGIIKHRRQNYLNTSTVEAMKPAPPVTKEPMKWSDGRKYFPFVHKLLGSMFADKEHEGTDQLVHLLAWLKYAYVHALARTPRIGQAIVIAGPPGKGKTFLSWKVISELLGGRSDASSHLVENDRWTERLLENPVMTIDDSSALTDRKSLREFTNKIKRYTANPEIMYEQKYAKTGEVPWLGRIVITCNLDAESLRILPDMDNSTQDKISLFKASDPVMEFADYDTNQRIIDKELPFFGRFLVDWPYPEDCVSEERRYGIKPYHHPDLFETSRQHGLGMLTEILNGFFTTYFNQPNKKFESEYVGTAMQLYEDMRTVFPSLTKELSYRALAMQLGKMEKAQYNVYKERDIETSQDLWHIHRNLNGIKKDFSENGREILS